MSNLNIKAVRRAGVSLVAIESADPAQSIASARRDLNGKEDVLALMQWDICNALRGLNSRGQNVAASITDGNAQIATQNPAECLTCLAKAGENTIVFFHNAQRYWGNEAIVQGIWNLRDLWKANGSTLVLLCTTASTLPEELKADDIVLTEPVPDEEVIADVIESVRKDAGLETVGDVAKITDTLLGYPSRFAVEQAFALGLTKTGADTPTLWELRVQAMKSLAGLEITLPKENYSALAGTTGIKQFNGAYLKGRRPPRVVFHLDEIEKMTAGSGTDSSGVTQALLEQFLYWTEQEKVDAELLLGVPGAGKTWTAICTAGEAGIPRARGSMSTVKGGLVGQSEAQMRTMLKAVSAIGQGRILMIATCNAVECLPPEVIARFKLGTFFYDYPTDEELTALWKLYIAKYELKDKPLKVTRWVGREVESCCHRAWLFRIPLVEAAKTVVPVSIASAAKMEALRKSAHGRFNAAAYPGTYDCEKTGATTGRKMEV